MEVGPHQENADEFVFSIDFPFNLDDPNIELNEMNEAGIPDNVLVDLIDNLPETKANENVQTVPIADTPIQQSKQNILKV